MIYSLLRSAAALALRWYYADVTIVGSDRVPLTGPLLVAVNHPNALVDVLVAGRAVPRRLMFTAKATLFANSVAAALLHRLGVVPLRRASDEAAAGAVDRSRNEQVFDAIAEALASNGAILIFPEGKSHDEPAVAPLRTGAARMAMHARTTRQVAGIRVVPIGLIFERKDRPRSRILAIVGEPIEVDAFHAGSSSVVADLTTEIDRRIRALTLNYSTIEEAERDARVSRTLSMLLLFDAPSVGDAGDLRMRAQIARQLPRLRAALLDVTGVHRERTIAFESALEALDQDLQAHRVSLADLTIPRDVGHGAVFVARELAVFLVAGPIALWGWINHLLPFRAALFVGGSVRDSAADPAMRTILAGTVFVLMMYGFQGMLVTMAAGRWLGIAYVLSLPIAADINLRMQDRLHRAVRRARTYLYFRRQPDVQDQLVRQATALRVEAIALARAGGLADIS